MEPEAPPPVYPIELEGPDIEPYRAGNTGVDYVTRLGSGRAGPHVLLTALVHGNEICGAIALDTLLREAMRPLCGTLTLAFVNVAAYRTFDPEKPDASRYVDEDFNRLWTAEVLDSPRQSAELSRARALRPLVDEADLLLDIHSMQNRTIPLMMAGPLAKGRELAQAIGTPATVVVDRGHDAGRRLRDYAGFGDPASGRNALLIECGQHWEKASAGVALDAACRFLLHAGLIDRDAAEPHLRPLPAQQRVIEVASPYTIETPHFRFTQAFSGMETIARAGTVIGHDGDRPVVTPFDDCVLIMPSKRRRKGDTAVRFGRYVEQAA